MFVYLFVVLVRQTSVAAASDEVCDEDPDDVAMLQGRG